MTSGTSQFSLKALHALRPRKDPCQTVVGGLFPEHFVIRCQLTQVVPRYTVPPLEVGDIYRWKSQVINEMLPPSGVSSYEPRFLSEEFVERCIEAAVEESLSMLNWEIKLLQKDNV